MWQYFTERYLIPHNGPSPILFGAILPGASILVGVIALWTGEAYFWNRWSHFNDRPPISWVTGTPALLGAGFYLGIGLWMHFTWCWSAHPRLKRYSPALSNLAILTVLGLAIACALLH